MRRSLDLYVSVALLAVCGIAWPEVWLIRHPSYAQISPALWTSASLAVFSGLCLLYFLRSAWALRAGRTRPAEASTKLAGIEEDATDELPDGWYINPAASIVCFALFLIAIPYLGMLASSFLFVLVLLLITSDRTLPSLTFDTALALCFVGFVYGLFTYVFGIIFPRGDFTGF